MDKVKRPVPVISTIIVMIAIIVIIPTLIAVGAFAWQEFNFTNASAEHAYGVVMEVEKDQVWFFDTMDADKAEFFSVNISGSDLHEGDFVAIESMTVVMRGDEFNVNGVIHEMYDIFRAGEINSQASQAS